jgi:hypothetical protein
MTLIKINKYTMRADKILAVEEGKFITNMGEPFRGGHFTATIFLEGGHTIHTTEDHAKVIEMWKSSMGLKDT